MSSLSSTMLRGAAFLLLGLPGCAAEDADFGESGGSEDGDLRSGKVGAYFVDGTTMTEKDDGVIAHIFTQVDTKTVKIKRYFSGPAVLCGDPKVAGSCDEVVATVEQAICDDLRAKRIERFVVFGYSRGVFIANKAARLAQKECASAGSYTYGGFVDAVMMTPSLAGAEVVPGATVWYHYHRASTEHLLYPVKMLMGGRGQNVSGPDVSHANMAQDKRVEIEIVKATNLKAGVKVFR